jgi:outer membrane lipoprotein-sorting protein
MKPFLFMALITVALLPVREQAQSLDEVIAKNIQARGGLENFRAIKTLRVTARFLQGGFRATYVQENKREDKIREELILQGMAQVQAYDGHTGWEIDPFRGRKDANLMSQDDLRALILDADLEGPLVDYKQKGHTAELIGHDSVEGTDCYKIKLTMKNGDVRYYYLDVDSYLEIKFQTQLKVRGAVQYNDTMLGDYEQVEGVYFPFSVETTETGSDNWARFTVEKIEVNVPLEDTRFSLPAPKAEAKPSSRPSEPHLADLSGGKNRSGGNFCE